MCPAYAWAPAAAVCFRGSHWLLPFQPEPQEEHMEHSTPDDSQTCTGEDKGMLLHDAALWGGLLSKQQKLTD